MNILEDVKEIIAEAMPEIDINEIEEDSFLKNDLGIDRDSLSEIAMTVEDRYGFLLNETEIETVADICDRIEENI